MLQNLEPDIPGPRASLSSGSVAAVQRSKAQASGIFTGCSGPCEVRNGVQLRTFAVF